MARSKVRFLCEECGHDEPKWLGQCPNCGSWNTLKEFKQSPGHKTPKNREPAQRAQAIQDIEPSSKIRTSTGIGEFDRVLGDGMMKGSVILLGGAPGIGKSTLLLQLAYQLGESEKALYISGEESPQQIQQRAIRLELKGSGPLVLCEEDVDGILENCQRENPDILLIDSIQTLISPRAGEVPGTVNQLKLCTAELLKWARENQATLILVAHVTKEGVIAGPRSIEHMVDTVLYFEHSSEELRCLRAQKNRFGSTHEIGLFLMGATGLLEVSDPSSLFLQNRNGPFPVGTVAATLYEGSRVLIVEIQALTVPAKGGLSRIYSERIENNRISRIAAILEKHLSLKFSDQDIYVHVAGGMRIQETAADLPIALALYSARTGIPLKESLIALGELSLAGEVRPVSQVNRRIKSAKEQGFSTFLGQIPEKKQTIENIKDAVKVAFSPKTSQ